MGKGIPWKEQLYLYQVEYIVKQTNKQTNVTRDKEHSNNKIADSSKNNNFKHICI